MTSPLDASVGHELLDELGFLHVPGHPTADGSAYLFVALRQKPTLQHFDPERVDFWVTAKGHGALSSVEWETREAPVAQHSWGMIRVIDRVNAVNEFATFGGDVLVARMADVKICVLSSEAPIIACGGHSQPWEPGSQDVTAFIGRLRAAADPRGDLERNLADMTPNARYSAYVADSLARARTAAERYDWTLTDKPALERERLRLSAVTPADWNAGLQLADTLATLDGD